MKEETELIQCAAMQKFVKYADSISKNLDLYVCVSYLPSFFLASLCSQNKSYNFCHNFDKPP